MSASQTKTKKNKGTIALIILAIVFLLISCVLLYSFFTNAKNYCKNNFSDAYNETKQETYDQFKQKAFDYYEEKNHVSNRATLTIGNIQEENSLEVLSVSDSWVKISEPDKDGSRTSRWVKFTANGVYTIDMKASQFITDSYNNFIIVKLKTPQLNNVALDLNPEIYHYNYEKKLFEVNGNYNSGMQEYINDREEAFAKLNDQLVSNDDNLSKAKDSAENIIKSLIKDLNPDADLKDSDIKIEFI